MKVKNNIEFLTFNDGAVTLYRTDENDDIIPSSGKTFAFGSRKIGIRNPSHTPLKDGVLNAE